MRVCMFHPVEKPMERGWVGRIADDQVIHLAAQTLQSFFTGGGVAREHAEYPRDAVRLLAPVLHPPSVRVFDDPRRFSFANPAAIVGPGARISRSGVTLSLVPRLAAVIGADGEAGGYTAFAEWLDPAEEPPKDRDFALGLGPSVFTVDALDPEGLAATVRVDGDETLAGAFSGFDWDAAIARAAAGTELRSGDLVAGPGLGLVEVAAGSTVELEVAGIGVLAYHLEP